MRSRRLVELLEVTKSYGRCRVFERVTVSVDRGEILGLIGPNGAGKTTLLRVLVGLLSPSHGVIRWCNRSSAGGPASVQVVYFAGASTLPPDARAHRWIRMFGSARDEGSERRRIRRLSEGTRQRVGLEATFSGPGAELVVLDEPWQGVDPPTARWLCEALSRKRRAGSGVVVSSHRLHDLAGLCDRYAFLVDGSLQSVAASALPQEMSAAALEIILDRFMGRRS